MDIYVTGPVGLSGALQLYKENIAFFEKRFAPFFNAKISKALCSCDFCDKTEFPLAKCNDCIYICTIADGGIFRALWEGCEKLQCGCEVFLEDIPIRQEVIEITELMNENPYELDSAGTFLVFAETQIAEDCKSLLSGITAKKQAEAFENNGNFEQRLVKIGKTTDRKDRVILVGETRRFLTPPGRQEKDSLDRKQHRS